MTLAKHMDILNAKKIDHIHHPEMCEMQGILYINCGDFVESCTAVVEHLDGRLEIIKWQIGMGNPQSDQIVIEKTLPISTENLVETS